MMNEPSKFAIVKAPAKVPARRRVSGKTLPCINPGLYTAVTFFIIMGRLQYTKDTAPQRTHWRIAGMSQKAWKRLVHDQLIPTHHILRYGGSDIDAWPSMAREKLYRYKDMLELYQRALEVERAKLCDVDAKEVL
jgi:hypothetical protein